jgi:predicted PurR-regulated permease PerM
MPIINRKKIRNLLSKAYENSLNKLNSNLAENINSLGSFSLTFDIWTASNQDSFLGLILIYINSNFELIYKLIGKLFISLSYLFFSLTLFIYFLL